MVTLRSASVMIQQRSPPTLKLDRMREPWRIASQFDFASSGVTSPQSPCDMATEKLVGGDTVAVEQVQCAGRCDNPA